MSRTQMTDTHKPLYLQIDGSAIFMDDMNGDNSVAGLESRGWVVLNEDAGGTVPAFFQPDGGVFTAYEGPDTGFVASNYQGANGFLIDQWLISPEITVAAGDTLSFWHRSPDANPYDDSIYVRLSTTAGITSADFDVTWGRYLVSESGWARWTGTFPSAGTVRFAIQYYIVDGGPSGNNSNYIGLDYFEVISAGGGVTTLFFDDFESGTAQWAFTGAWGLTELQSVSPTHSLTESPVGNYPPNQNITATMVTGLDLSAYLGAEVTFWARYSIEQGFDYMYLQVSTNNGTTWLTQEAFNAENVPWTQYTYDLGGFVGNSDVKIRFRFFSDGGYEVDGMYIDDFTVTGSTVDFSPPLIVHTGPEFYEGVIGEYTATTDITDVSGIQSATLYYTVDGGSPISVAPTSVVGDVYTFTIPSTIPGSNIDYYIESTDNQSNTTVNPPVYSYISGTYIKYDDPTVDFVTNFGPLSGQLGAAVRMTVPAGNPGNLVTALIRNYTDINRPNSDMEFHVWANNGGIPGADLITPFLVTPEATVANTSPMTRIDLRPYFTQLSGLTGDFWIGFMVPQDTVWITIKQPGTALRSFYNNGSTWVVYTNTDFHFRCILGDERNVPVELTSFTANVTQGNVVLNWTTATEINNQGFEVQKRTAEGQFATIGHVQGNGTTTEIKNYSFTDAGVALGTYYYRLKQVDFNGDFEFSNEIFVDVDAPLEFALAQNYPNPFNPTTSINFSIAEPTFVKLAIYNLLGEEVQVLKNDYMEAGTFKINFDASSLPSGMYLYKIETAQYSSVKKMLLMK